MGPAASEEDRCQRTQDQGKEDPDQFSFMIFHALHLPFGQLPVRKNFLYDILQDRPGKNKFHFAFHQIG